MRSFAEYLQEAKSTTATFTFGRFQPPTIGHEKLLNAVKEAARGGDYFIYPSRSEDNRDNPLPWKFKVQVLRDMFPSMADHIMLDSNVNTFFDAASALYSKGYRNIRMVVGQDRVEKFKDLLTKYNGGDGYNFYSIDVVSAGDRDPDSDGVTGMSASKMRAFVREGNFDAFSRGLPKGYKNKQGLYDVLAQKLG